MFKSLFDLLVNELCSFGSWISCIIWHKSTLMGKRKNAFIFNLLNLLTLQWRHVKKEKETERFFIWKRKLHGECKRTDEITLVYISMTMEISKKKNKVSQKTKTKGQIWILSKCAQQRMKNQYLFWTQNGIKKLKIENWKSFLL